MTGKELYKIYAPENAKWVQWIRPVPFIAIDTYGRKETIYWNEKKPTFMSKYESDSVILVDLTGNDSIEYGIAIAKLGYRPIPLFNGTDAQKNSKCTTDSDFIESSLINAGIILKNMSISLDANPVFMIDSSRLNRFRHSITIFDNSWDLYGQDVPSAEYLINNKIKKVILLSNKINRDIKKILIKYQAKGLDIFLTDGYDVPKKIVVRQTLKEKLEKEEL